MEGKEYDVLLKTYNKRLSKTPTTLKLTNMKEPILSDETIKEKISQTEILESNSYPPRQAYYNGACFARRTYQSEIEKRDKRIEELEKLLMPNIQFCNCEHGFKKKNYDECAICGGKWKGRHK